MLSTHLSDSKAPLFSDTWHDSICGSLYDLEQTNSNLISASTLWIKKKSCFQGIIFPLPGSVSKGPPSFTLTVDGPMLGDNGASGANTQIYCDFLNGTAAFCSENVISQILFLIFLCFSPLSTLMILEP